MRNSSVLRGLFVAALVWASPAVPACAQELKTVELGIAGHRLVAEVAATQATRTTGLMNRFSLKPDHGMLFVFPEEQPMAFWMHNTYVPLSIAFIAADGHILNIEDMAPLTESTHPSRGQALYALEMKKGWFAERGISAGAQIEGIDKAPKARE
ncbi:MAG: DUF192 domain-containing protein [Betaproteobacteria bacterium]|nr:MAG: DUF192 domain-containing protein [Betaproteobacteria bacterium]